MGAATAAQYLSQWDSVYNASHPNCHFRAFFLNMCPPGQSRLAVDREKWIAQGRGGGPSEETWLAAVRDNPDPEHFYPAPSHFAFGLQQRQEKQLEQIGSSHSHISNIKNKQTELNELHEKNEQRLKKLVSEEALIERKLLVAMSRAEVLRRSGIRISTAEEHDIQQKISNIGTALSGTSPDSIHGRLRSLMSLVESQDSAATEEDDRLVRQLGQSVDAPTLRDWARLLASKDTAIRALQSVVQRDLEDIRAVIRRISPAS